MAIVLTALGTSGCGSSSTPAITVSRPTATTVRRPHRPTPVQAGAPVGAAQLVHAGGTTLSVSISRVIDPLSDSGAALLSGTHAVAVLVRIQNRGPGVYDSSATGDIGLVPSSGTATPVFAPRGQCQTPLRDFDNYISPGEIRAGCVVFAVPSTARVVDVRFSPHGQAAGAASWRTAG